MTTNTFCSLLLFILFICLATTLRIHQTDPTHSFTRNQQHQHIIQHHQQLSIHQSSEQPIYDEQRYLVDLAQKQNAFKQQITDIQNNFAGINMMLNDTNLSNKQKKIKLNEALADERDSLLTAQSQLNIPYKLKSCQCLNLTEQKRDNIRKQLQTVKTKIQQLDKKSAQTNKNCQVRDCPLMKEINSQIEMLKKYQTFMQQTIDSKCCKVIKYEYRDNLDSNNWHFGNTTQNQYQALIFQKEKEKNLKLQPCPYNAPWVQFQQNSCFNCPPERPLFNLGKRVCQKNCVEAAKNDAYVLNLTTHICGYNANCPQGQYFDDFFKKCSQAPSYYNESSCPPNKPFWDPLSYSCQSCPIDTPFFDAVYRRCRKCNPNQIWNQVERSCKTSAKCQQGYYLDSITNTCLPVNKDTHSLCPPTRPYWNELTYSCDECPEGSPYYDQVTRLCRKCNDGEVFKAYSKECAPKDVTVNCNNGQFYNNRTKSCQKRGTTSMCPPSTPYWDATNFKCLQCPLNLPWFNDKTRQCEQCTANHAWSQTYLVCIQNCWNGEEWNQEYKKCIKKDKTCPQKSAFSYESNSCIEINCNEARPFWNVSSNVCQQCPPGTVYNYVVNQCEKNSRSGNVSVCHQDKPIWNPQYLRCQPCPEGKQWNSDLLICLPKTGYSHNHKKSQNHKYSHQASLVHEQEYVIGKVYGNSQISYQYGPLAMASSSS